MGFVGYMLDFCWGFLVKLIFGKILEWLRERVAHFDKEKTKTFITDVVRRNIRSNTMSGTGISPVSDMMSSEFEIMEI